MIVILRSTSTILDNSDKVSCGLEWNEGIMLCLFSIPIFFFRIDFDHEQRIEMGYLVIIRSGVVDPRWSCDSVSKLAYHEDTISDLEPVIQRKASVLGQVVSQDSNL